MDQLNAVGNLSLSEGFHAFCVIGAVITTNTSLAYFKLKSCTLHIDLDRLTDIEPKFNIEIPPICSTLMQISRSRVLEVMHKNKVGHTLTVIMRLCSFRFPTIISS